MAMGKPRGRWSIAGQRAEQRVDPIPFHMSQRDELARHSTPNVSGRDGPDYSQAESLTSTEATRTFSRPRSVMRFQRSPAKDLAGARRALDRKIRLHCECVAAVERRSVKIRTGVIQSPDLSLLAPKKRWVDLEIVQHVADARYAYLAERAGVSKAPATEWPRVERMLPNLATVRRKRASGPDGAVGR